MKDSEAGLPASRFYMWRTIFAMVHADHVVMLQEVAFLYENTQDLPLSNAQREILMRDLKEPQNPADMFLHITEKKDREEFFVMARVLCWSDGNFDEPERKVIKMLEEIASDRDAAELLACGDQTAQEVELKKDQWTFDHPDEKPFFDFLDRLLKKDSSVQERNAY